MKNILVRQPCYSFGNIGDLALVKTVKNTYKNCNLIIPSSVKELNNTDISNIDFLIYFGNDCIAYYDISENIIRKFLSKKKNVYLLNTSWGGNPEKDNVYTTEKRMIVLGKSKDGMIEILKGLTIDELIADEGVSLLVSNQKVKRILE